VPLLLLPETTSRTHRNWLLLPKFMLFILQIPFLSDLVYSRVCWLFCCFCLVLLLLRVYRAMDENMLDVGQSLIYSRALFVFGIRAGETFMIKTPRGSRSGHFLSLSNSVASCFIDKRGRIMIDLERVRLSE
jgi:hypothetical protein